MIQERVAVILPAYNEAGAIGRVIDEIKALPFDCGIFVADSESTDETAIVAVEKGAAVLSCHRGKGRAVREALKRVSADYIFMLDSDCSYPARYLYNMLELLQGVRDPPHVYLPYDAVYGWRCRIEIGAMSKLHRIGNKLLTFLANILYAPPRTHDLCTGMWGFRRETAELLAQELTSDRFTLEADIYSILAKHKCRIDYTMITYRARRGESKLRIRDAFEIAWFLIKRRFK